MALTRDPETLKIPAFMRKRSISARMRRPLILTALDRKKAGLPPEGVKPKIRAPRKRRTTNKPANNLMLKFFNPLTEPYMKTASPKKKKIGIITHYYDKISVGVIKLAGPLSVGDCITYETKDGPYEQIVESMQINHEDVSKAGKGKEAGMKLNSVPKVGTTVLK